MAFNPFTVPLREADTPRKYKVAPRAETALELVVRLRTPVDNRRQRFPSVGEQEANRIRR